MASDWVELPLGEVVTFLSGGTPSKARAEYWQGVIPWASAKDMKSYLLEDTEDHISEDALQTATKLVPRNTVLLLTRGMTLLNDIPICRIAVPMTFNQDVRAVTAKSGLLQAFLPYLLLGHKTNLLELVDLAGHGTGRLNSDSLKSLPILLPPESEQMKIAGFLGAIDESLSLLARKSESLEAIAKAIFKSWFVDFDPVRAKAEGRQPEGMDAATAALFPGTLVASELGDIPQGWAAKYIGDCAEIVGGSTPSTAKAIYWNGGQHCWATPKDLSNNKSPILLSTERKVTDEGRDDISSGLLPVGTVLLSSRAPIGYLAIAKVPTAINQGFIALKPLGKVSSEFLILWAAAAMETIKSLANGSTFQEISKRNFRTIQLVRPSGEVLDAFNAIVKPLYDRITMNVGQMETLSQLRDTLLPRLISGKLRVPEAEKLVEAAL